MVYLNNVNKTQVRIIVKILFLIMLILLAFTTTYARADSDRDALREKLEEQEESLKDEMQPINPLEDTDKIENYMDDITDSVKLEGLTGEFNVQDKINGIQKSLFLIIIKTRTVAIILYSAIWVIGIIYSATMGSRDVNKRRKVFLIIRNSTVLFFIYINIPLFIIWFNTDKSILTQLKLFDVVYDILEFLQRNSVIISSLLLFSGISRLIISKNDLPVRKQGIYLIKFSVILLFVLNIAPVAMNFLI